MNKIITSLELSPSVFNVAARILGLRGSTAMLSSWLVVPVLEGESTELPPEGAPTIMFRAPTLPTVSIRSDAVSDFYNSIMKTAQEKMIVIFTKLKMR